MILNILNNPIRIVGALVIKLLLRTFGLSTTTFFPFFNVLYQSATSLSRSVGVIPTLRVVWHIGRHLSSTFPTMRLILTGNNTLNQYIVQTILTAIQPYHRDGLEPNLFQRY